MSELIQTGTIETTRPLPTGDRRTLIHEDCGSRRLQVALASRYFPQFDGLRAASVLLVIFYHFGFGRSPAGVGVLSFFVLSGFLITWLLLLEQDRTGTISVRGFYARRCFRTFPAFYCYWFIAVALLLTRHKGISWRHALAAFFYVSDYYNAIAHPAASYFSHTWSLGVEEQFYLLWPLLVYLCRRRLDVLTLILACVICGEWIYRPVLELLFRRDQSYIYNSFDTRVDHLLAGCLLAILLKRQLLNSLCDRLYATPALSLITISLLAISSQLGLDTRYRDWCGFVIDPILICLIFLQALMNPLGLWNWTINPAMRYIGRISYSLYLYQGITLYPARIMTERLPKIVQAGVALVVTIVVASISYYAVERPFLKIKARLGALGPHWRRKSIMTRNTVEERP